MTTFDLIVVGAGIIGAACADAAAGAGLRVAVIEPAGIGGGATAAAMGHLVALDEDPAELALAHYSQRLWDEFIDSPAAQFRRCGTLWVAREARECDAIGLKLARLRNAGIDAEAVDAIALRRLEPALARGLAGGVHVPGDAVVYPPNVARLLVERACGRGARLYAGRRACSVESGGVLLDDRTRLSGPALIAT